MIWAVVKTICIDILEKININSEEDDSSDSDIIEPTRKRRNLIDSDVKENIPVEDNISSSEKCPTQTFLQ